MSDDQRVLRRAVDVLRCPALPTPSKRLFTQAHPDIKAAPAYSHIVVEVERRAIERGGEIVIALGKGHDRRERASLDAAQRMSTCDEGDHLRLVEALPCEVGDVAVDVLLGLGHTWVVGLGGIDAATAEWYFRSIARWQLG